MERNGGRRISLNSTVILLISKADHGQVQRDYFKFHCDSINIYPPF